MNNAMHTVARLALLLVVFLAAAPHAIAQFGTPASTTVRERLTGRLLSASGAPTPDAQDQIGAFFNNQAVGVFSFTSTSTEFSFIVYGDIPTTTAVEGPRAGQPVQFRFFDASTNTVRTDVRVENTSGEPLNYVYGGELIEIPDDFPFPIDITPTRNVNLRVGVTSGGNDDDDDDADSPLDRYDLDENGKIDDEDAALVLRAMIQGGSAPATASTGATTSTTGTGTTTDTTAAASTNRLDVNRDGRVTSADAVEVLRNQGRK